MYYDKKLQSLAWKGVERENGSPKVWKSHGWVSTIHRFTSDTIEEDYFLRSFKYSFVLFCSSCAQCHCVGQCSCCSPWEAKRGSRPQSGQHFEVLVLLVVSWFLLPWSNNIWIILWIYIYIYCVWIYNIRGLRLETVGIVSHVEGHRMSSTSNLRIRRFCHPRRWRRQGNFPWIWVTENIWKYDQYGCRFCMIWWQVMSSSSWLKAKLLPSRTELNPSSCAIHLRFQSC